ncbi:MAG: hypothetical protein LQ350_008249 [Teloschistes chrysophthalmus]|nr:MAG: hypothetical protein LQ350_008249 [Niorma chrysophthalma]
MEDTAIGQVLGLALLAFKDGQPRDHLWRPEVKAQLKKYSIHAFDDFLLGRLSASAGSTPAPVSEFKSMSKPFVARDYSFRNTRRRDELSNAEPDPSSSKGNASIPMSADQTDSRVSSNEPSARSSVCWGHAVPVYLGNVNLVHKYYLTVRVRILDMMLLLWGGKMCGHDPVGYDNPDCDPSMQDEAWKTWFINKKKTKPAAKKGSTKDLEGQEKLFAGDAKKLLQESSPNKNLASRSAVKRKIDQLGEGELSDVEAEEYGRDVTGGSSKRFRTENTSNLVAQD